jgi:hypothetical protein
MDSADDRTKGTLVATPAARDRAIEKLQDHYAKNHLEVEDFEKLVELAERAKNNDELTRLFDGLPTLDEPVSDALATTSPGVPGKMTATIGAVLGSTTRRGRWRVPSRVAVKAWLGSVELDLSEADFDRAETVIEVSAFMGSIEIDVPEGLAVECEGNAILGSFDHLVTSAATKRDHRVVRVVGKATLGSVEIKVKKRTSVLESVKSAVRGLLGP